MQYPLSSDSGQLHAGVVLHSGQQPGTRGSLDNTFLQRSWEQRTLCTVCAAHTLHTSVSSELNLCANYNRGKHLVFGLSCRIKYRSNLKRFIAFATVVQQSWKNFLTVYPPSGHSGKPKYQFWIAQSIDNPPSSRHSAIKFYSATIKKIIMSLLP